MRPSGDQAPPRGWPSAADLGWGAFSWRPLHAPEARSPPEPTRFVARLGRSTAALALAACSVLPAGTPAAEALTAAAPSKSPVAGVAGEAISISDVGTEPNRRFDEGWVVTIRAIGSQDFWVVAGTDEPLERNLPWARASVDSADLATLPGAAMAMVDSDGRFTVDVDAGAHLLCVAFGPGEPIKLMGCGLADIPNVGFITITHGEGGVGV